MQQLHNLIHTLTISLIVFKMILSPYRKIHNIFIIIYYMIYFDKLQKNFIQFIA